MYTIHICIYTAFIYLHVVAHLLSKVVSFCDEQEENNQLFPKRKEQKAQKAHNLCYYDFMYVHVLFI